MQLLLAQKSQKLKIKTPSYKKELKIFLRPLILNNHATLDGKFHQYPPVSTFKKVCPYIPKILERQ